MAQLLPGYTKHPPQRFTWLKRNTHLWVYKLVALPEESRRHEASGALILE